MIDFWPMITYLFGVFLCVMLLTSLVYRYAVTRGVIDLPNARSSHQELTPRGGGVAIVIIFLVVLFITWHTGIITKHLFAALFGAGVLVALVGFIDDHRHVPQQWRLIIHFAASFWALYWLGGAPPLQIAGYIIEDGWLSIIIAGILLVWWLNLFNFMDGTDGIACMEVIFITSSSAIFAWATGLENLAFMQILLAISTLGFLVWNFPPAKIFMGDTGSGFLGIVVGILAYSSAINGVSFWSWLILSGVFIVDATVTLLRRVLRGDKWYEAHRSHAYQRYVASIEVDLGRTRSHRKLLYVIMIINITWLLPCAYVGFLYPEWGLLITLIAFSPLLMAALKIGAGLPDMKIV